MKRVRVFMVSVVGQQNPFMLLTVIPKRTVVEIFWKVVGKSLQVEVKSHEHIPEAEIHKELAKIQQMAFDVYIRQQPAHVNPSILFRILASQAILGMSGIDQRRLGRIPPQIQLHFLWLRSVGDWQASL